MRITSKPVRLAAAVAALSLVAAACGSDDDSSTSDGDATDTTEATDDMAAAECETANDEDDSVASLTELDFSGLDLNVGSKDFTEQFVLEPARHRGPRSRRRQRHRLDEPRRHCGQPRDPMLSDQIDMYFEYNGTGWTNHLALPDPSFDPVELTNGVCVTDLAEMTSVGSAWHRSTTPTASPLLPTRRRPASTCRP